MILLPWIVFSLMTFGSPLPSTLPAKMAQMQSGYWPPFLSTSLEWLAAYAIKTPHFAHLDPNYVYLITFILAGLGVVSLLLNPQFNWWAIFIGVGPYMVGYHFLGIPFYRWSVVPLAFGQFIAAGLGAQLVYDFISQKTISLGKGYQSGAIIAFIAILSLPLITAFNFIREYATQPLHSEYRLYTQTGLWLQQNTPPTATVGYFEIGFMGYYADRIFIDPVGLVNTGVAERVASGNLKWAYQYYKPDYLVIHPIRWYDQLGNIREESWFNKAYREIATIE